MATKGRSFDNSTSGQLRDRLFHYQSSQSISTSRLQWDCVTSTPIHSLRGGAVHAPACVGMTEMYGALPMSLLPVAGAIDRYRAIPQVQNQQFYSPNSMVRRYTATS